MVNIVQIRSTLTQFKISIQTRVHLIQVRSIYNNFQLIKLINFLKHDKNNTILRKITEKSHSYNGFAFNVTRCFLNTDDPICRIDNCYVCRSS